MEQQEFFVRGRHYAAGDPALQAVLASIYGSSERPRCMCVPGGVPMYIANHGFYVVKRMPETGKSHHPGCPSFEPEAGLSGLGELQGEAIIEHAPDQIELRTAFALMRKSGACSPRGPASEDVKQVKASRHAMSLRALLHFLYERAGFNRWYPAMTGRRNWAVIHKYLQDAAEGVLLKGSTLDEKLFVPEPFRVECRDEIADRRRRKLAALTSPESANTFNMGLLVGQYNGSEPTQQGRRIIVKHMPDSPLFIDNKAWTKAERTYGTMLQACEADVEHKPRILMIALVYAKREFVYQVDTLSMMMVTDQWIPLDDLHELPLLESLVQAGRSFIKPLRYDSGPAAGIPSALLLDCLHAPMPMYVLSAFADDRGHAQQERAVRDRGEAAWSWRTQEPMPELPPLARHAHGPARPPTLTGTTP
ncbi:DUF1173 family protein [Azohydromonas lata]|uniref:DUF1173 family protein n=1 Tax=Azohydromonas lata TaxID=45677 RepID=A0ABU5I7B7_9BURK|nr:DUF1173 family protein [Azohydromonas lata]MDZ5454990.1 DUF1173 family protein [Azohydromonas lata]